MAVVSLSGADVLFRVSFHCYLQTECELVVQELGMHSGPEMRQSDREETLVFVFEIHGRREELQGSMQENQELIEDSHLDLSHP